MGIFDFLLKKFGAVAETEYEKIKETEPELPPLKNGNALPHSIEDLKEWHIRALRKLNKHPENIPFSGLISLEVDMPKFIRFAFVHELITYIPYDDVLYMLKNESLKSILRENGLRVSGNKNELVCRIQQSIDINTVMNSDYYTDFYMLTPKGRELLQQASARIAEEEYIFFTENMSLILDYRFNEAYRMLCKKYAEMPVSPGMNCDWKERYYNGLSFEQIQFFCEELDNSKNKTVTAAAIFDHMSAETIRTIAEYLKLMDNTLPEDVKDTLHYQTSMMSTKRHLKSYIEGNIKEYQFLATFDINTCPVCAKLDGKIFKVSEAKIGVNCPPMHRSCRCITVAVINREWLRKGTRGARDENWHPISIPMSMTYDEWYDKYGQFTRRR